MQEEIVKNIILGEDEDYIINMGPQHPSTHGVLRFEVSLQGETDKKGGTPLRIYSPRN